MEDVREARAQLLERAIFAEASCELEAGCHHLIIRHASVCACSNDGARRRSGNVRARGGDDAKVTESGGSADEVRKQQASCREAETQAAPLAFRLALTSEHTARAR